MPVIKVKDEGGDTMTLLEVTGHYLPVLRIPGYNQEAEVRSMESWEARPDDVLLCAYPKSGKLIKYLHTYYLVCDVQNQTEKNFFPCSECLKCHVGDTIKVRYEKRNTKIDRYLSWVVEIIRPLLMCFI